MGTSLSHSLLRAGRQAHGAVLAAAPGTGPRKELKAKNFQYNDAAVGENSSMDKLLVHGRLIDAKQPTRTPKSQKQMPQDPQQCPK